MKTCVLPVAISIRFSEDVDLSMSALIMSVAGLEILLTQGINREYSPIPSEVLFYLRNSCSFLGVAEQSCIPNSLGFYAVMPTS